LIGAVKAGSTVFVRWAKAVASLPGAQAFDGDAGQRRNAANAIKIVWYLICHRFCIGTKGRQEYGYILICPDRVSWLVWRHRAVFSLSKGCHPPRAVNLGFQVRSGHQ
jgi:hypothetical protein